MRISTAFQFDRYNAQIAQAQSRYMDAERQVMTGKRLERPSDDPFATGLIVRKNSLKRAAEQVQSNIRVAKDYAGNTEQALGETHGLIRRAYQIAVGAANESVSFEAMQGMASEIEQMQGRMLQLANTRGGSGQFIFAGQENDQAPFAQASGSLVYSGDNDPVFIEIGPGESLRVNTDADDLFIDAYAALEQLKTNLRGGDRSAIAGVDIEELQSQMDVVLVARAQAGSAIQQVERLETAQTRRVDELTKQISDLEEVDMAEAIQSYKLAETAYQAALMASSRGFQLSLMDFMR